MILHGPPGSGKTTLARIIAASASAAFEELSAVEAGRAEVRAVLARARERRLGERETIFFLDEIHRFNKGQQDALLPAVEEGLVTLIGATTENPSFEVNRALLSRTRLYELSELTEENVLTLLRRALEHGECGEVEVDDEAIEMLAARAQGDARTALSALELACETAIERVTVEHAEDALQRRIVHYDKQADSHYDTISAWIKATRGSDPDASLYYLAVMLEGGEDPRFIARRMVILASEDIGNADPNALTVATGAAAPSSTRACPSASSRSPRPPSTCRSRRSQTRPSARSAPRAISCASTAPPHPRCSCAPAGADRAMTTRIRTPATSQTKSSLPTRLSASASTGPTTPRPSWRHGWPRFAALAVARAERACRVAHSFAVPGRTCTTRPDGTCAVRGQATCGLPFTDVSIVAFLAISSSFVVVFQFLAVATTPKRLSDSIRASRELWMPAGCHA